MEKSLKSVGIVQFTTLVSKKKKKFNNNVLFNS